MNRTGVVKDRRYMEHVMDPGHPESPERLREIYQMIEEEEMRGRLLGKVKPRPATRAEIEMDGLGRHGGRPSEVPHAQAPGRARWPGETSRT